jgi:hypothetical protein
MGPGARFRLLAKGTSPVALDGAEPLVRLSTRTSSPTTRWSLTMLWTILIILAIVALAIFILSRVRGGRSRL